MRFERLGPEAVLRHAVMPRLTWQILMTGDPAEGYCTQYCVHLARRKHEKHKMRRERRLLSNDVLEEDRRRCALPLVLFLNKNSNGMRYPSLNGLRRTTPHSETMQNAAENCGYTRGMRHREDSSAARLPSQWGRGSHDERGKWRRSRRGAARLFPA